MRLLFKLVSLVWRKWKVIFVFLLGKFWKLMDSRRVKEKKKSYKLPFIFFSHKVNKSVIWFEKSEFLSVDTGDSSFLLFAVKRHVPGVKSKVIISIFQVIFIFEGIFGNFRDFCLSGHKNHSLTLYSLLWKLICLQFYHFQVCVIVSGLTFLRQLYIG